MGEEAYLLPIGPYHPLLKEPEYFKVWVRGEDVVGIDFDLGFNYRGVEELATQRSWIKALHLIGRICGICSIAHTLNFCQAIEELASIEVPNRAQWIRTMLCELNRIHSHLLWLGIAGYAIGFDTLFKWSWGTRELVLDWLEELTGNRILYEMCVFGGVRRDLGARLMEKMRAGLRRLRKEVDELYEIGRTNAIVAKRMDRIGRLEAKAAMELGVVGPTLRGSGIARDVRKDVAYAAYPELEFKVVIERGCDCKARMLVRLRECLESIWMVEQLLDGMPGGRVRAIEYVKLKFLKVPKGEVIARVEAPRGENFHYVVSNGKQEPSRVRIRPPTYANLIALEQMMRGAKLADVPIIIQSIDPCFGCTDRYEVIDVNSGRRKVMRCEELVRMG